MPQLNYLLAWLALALAVVGGRSPSHAAAIGDSVHSEQATFVLESLTQGLEHPWGMAFLPDGSLLITEVAGRMRLFKDGKLQEEPLAGVPPVFAQGQGGLLDVTLHPNYAENGWIYFAYAGIDEAGKGAGTRVARAKLGEGRLTDLEVIYRSNAVSGSGIHFGSRLVFDRSGQLYVSHGERGDGAKAQDLARHNGKILRLNDDGSVPADNPFVGQAGAAPEVFAYGVRNPQGMALHPETGALWENEHGPMGGDEVNIIRPGVNYGWPLITWGIDYSGEPINGGLRRQDGLAQPLHYWDPSIAPAGMAFYQGDAFPEWQGDLLVAALKFELVARLELDGDRVVGEERLLEGELGRIRDIEVGPDGYVYLLTDEPEAALIRLVPA
jgi:glucose/arabinose dehydrogenase